MSKSESIIVGAGLSGLIAGCAFPDALIIDQAPAPMERHKALLRFRSDAVATLTQIPFKKVLVHKAVWDGMELHDKATIRDMNLYSGKVTGMYLSRSINDLKPVERYIAPENFYEQLIDRHGSRIAWNTSFDYNEWERRTYSIISTAPLYAILDMLSQQGCSLPDQTLGAQFHSASIRVERWRILDAGKGLFPRTACDLYQTIYVTAPNTDVYRISITGDLLIIESMHPDTTERSTDELASAYLDRLFGITAPVEFLGASGQKNGKIVPVDERWRREVLRTLTSDYGIYSIGRFATWRNILLDDLVKDISVIRSLIAGDAYHAAIKSSV